MKLLRISFLLIFSCNLFAQQAKRSPAVNQTTDSLSSANKVNRDSTLLAFNNPVADTDTFSAEIPEGVIYVRKPHINPYVKVDYKLFLSRVSMMTVDVPVGEGIMPEQTQVPVYDTLAYQRAFYVKNF